MRATTGDRRRGGSSPGLGDDLVSSAKRTSFLLLLTALLMWQLSGQYAQYNKDLRLVYALWMAHELTARECLSHWTYEEIQPLHEVPPTGRHVVGFLTRRWAGTRVDSFVTVARLRNVRRPLESHRLGYNVSIIPGDSLYLETVPLPHRFPLPEDTDFAFVWHQTDSLAREMRIQAFRQAPDSSHPEGWRTSKTYFSFVVSDSGEIEARAFSAIRRVGLEHGDFTLLPQRYHDRVRDRTHRVPLLGVDVPVKFASHLGLVLTIVLTWRHAYLLNRLRRGSQRARSVHWSVLERPPIRVRWPEHILVVFWQWANTAVVFIAPAISLWFFGSISHSWVLTSVALVLLILALVESARNIPELRGH